MKAKLTYFLVLVLFACKGFAYTSPDISENAGIIAFDDVQQVMDQPHVSIPVHELEGLMETDLSVDNDNDEEESVRDKKRDLAVGAAFTRFAFLLTGNHDQPALTDKYLPFPILQASSARYIFLCVIRI